MVLPGLERFLKSSIFGVRATDPVTLTTGGIGFILATALASLPRAMRIVRLNASDALRSE